MIETLLEADEGEGRRRVHRVVADLGDQRDVLDRRQRGDEIIELEDEADAVAPIVGERIIVA